MSLLAEIQTEVEKRTKGYRNSIDSNIASTKATLASLRAQQTEHITAAARIAERMVTLSAELKSYEADLVKYNEEIAKVNSWLNKSEPASAKLVFVNVGDKTVGEILYNLNTSANHIFTANNVPCSKSATQVSRVLDTLAAHQILVKTKPGWYRCTDSTKQAVLTVMKAYPHQTTLVGTFSQPTTKTVVGPGPASTGTVTDTNDNYKSFTLTGGVQNAVLQWRSRQPRSVAACSLVGAIVGMELASGCSYQGSYEECAAALTELNLWQHIKRALHKNGWTAEHLLSVVKHYSPCEHKDQLTSQLTDSK